jgi:hypothetical protein
MLNFKTSLENILTHIGYERSETANELHFYVSLTMILNEYYTYKSYETEEHSGFIDPMTGIGKKNHILFDELLKYLQCNIVNGVLIKDENKQVASKGIELLKRMDIVYAIYNEIIKLLGDNKDNYFNYLMLKPVTHNDITYANVFEYLVNDMKESGRCLHTMLVIVLLTDNTSLIKTSTIYTYLNRILFMFVGLIEYRNTDAQILNIMSRVGNTMRIILGYSKINIRQYFSKVREELTWDLIDEINIVKEYQGNYFRLQRRNGETGSYSEMMYRRLIAIKIYNKLAETQKVILKIDNDLCNSIMPTMQKYHMLLPLHIAETQLKKLWEQWTGVMLSCTIDTRIQQ